MRTRCIAWWCQHNAKSSISGQPNTQFPQLLHVPPHTKVHIYHGVGGFYVADNWNLSFYWPRSWEIIRLLASVRLLALLFIRVVVDLWARLAECSKSTIAHGNTPWHTEFNPWSVGLRNMAHGIQSKINVCLSVIRGHLRSALHSGRWRFKRSPYIGICYIAARSLTAYWPIHMDLLYSGTHFDCMGTHTLYSGMLHDSIGVHIKGFVI